MGKQFGVILLILALILIGACSAPTDTAGQDMKDSISAMVAEKVRVVQEKDADALMEMLDPEEKELMVEQANWLIDIKINPIDEYSLELLTLDKVSDTVYRAKLLQRYKRDGEEFELKYYNKYRVIDDKIYDAGNYFEQLKQGNVTIQYTPANKKLSEDVIGDMDKLYQENIAKWKITPQRPLVVKMFDDIEELRQSIKLSMWPCGGWYEYGESVKMLVKKPYSNAVTIKQTVNHEMTHLFTVEKASGNLAYWLSEGIASYYEAPDMQKSPKALRSEMQIKPLTIDEIEALELEKLEDRDEIRNYYNNAHLMAAFIIERYGEEKVVEILEELSKLPSYTGTTSENDKYYREYLRQVLPKVLGLKDYEAFEEIWRDEIEKL